MTREQWAKLSPEIQRIMVAELCGWKDIEPENCSPLFDVVSGRRDSIVYTEIPDYLNDLNAMHEAEELVKTDELFGEYGIWLERLGDWDGFCATAAQRAEAFVLTMKGK